MFVGADCKRLNRRLFPIRQYLILNDRILPDSEVLRQSSCVRLYYYRRQYRSRGVPSRLSQPCRRQASEHEHLWSSHQAT